MGYIRNCEGEGSAPNPFQAGVRFRLLLHCEPTRLVQLRQRLDIAKAMEFHCPVGIAAAHDKLSTVICAHVG